MRNAERLIEAVRSRPFLYDQSLQTFRHLGTKNQNWMEVAKIVHGRNDKAAVNKVKMQWKSLRDAFVKQQRKRQITGSSARRYIYEREMQFLLPHILMKEKDQPMSPDGTTSKIHVKTEDSASLSASFSGDSQAELEQEDGAVEEFLRLPHPQPQPTVQEENVERERVHNAAEMHPVDAFFHGIAQTVKRLKPATVARLKKAVANVVMDAEIEEIESNGGTTYFS